MQIEAILKPKKTSRPRKKKGGDEVLDSFADDEVARLREAMLHAADEDIRANEEKLPATAKLRMLSEAMETLRKLVTSRIVMLNVRTDTTSFRASLAQSIIDNNLLEAVRRWLEPLRDKSLPALNIQRELFFSIRKMEFIDTAVLKESQLGRVVLFYTKCKRVTPDIARIANHLVSTWSRPIIKRSASYRDRVVPIAALAEDGVPKEHLNTILAKLKDEERGRIRKHTVQVPHAVIGDYTIAPRATTGFSRPNVSVDMDIERRRKNNEMLRSFTRRVANK